MRNRTIVLSLAVVAAIGFSSVMFSQQRGAIESQTPDLSGVWSMRTSPTTRYLVGTFTAEEPPMTPWAKERMKLNKPSLGPNGVADSNDPVNPTTIDAMGCFPPGVPRIYLHPFPMEIVQS